MEKVIRLWTVATLYSRMDLACNIALEATSMVTVEQDGRREIDIKRYAKVEKVIIVTMRQKDFNTVDQSEISETQLSVYFITRETEIGLPYFFTSQRDLT